jgi:hypothetical protein
MNLETTSFQKLTLYPPPLFRVVIFSLLVCQTYRENGTDPSIKGRDDQILFNKSFSSSQRAATTTNITQSREGETEIEKEKKQFFLFEKIIF